LEQLALRLRDEIFVPGIRPQLAQAFIALWKQTNKLARGMAEQALSEQLHAVSQERKGLAAAEHQARVELAQRGSKQLM